MRTHHCLTAFLCGAFLLGAGMAQAQMPPGTAGYAQFPSHAAIDTSAMQPGYSYPYPAVSPFDHAFESTYNSGGQWITDRNPDHANKYAFSIEWLYGIVNGAPDDKVGWDQTNGSIPQMFFSRGDMAIENDDVGRYIPPIPLLGIPGTPLYGGQDPDVRAFNGGQGPYGPFQSGLLDAVGVSGLQLKFDVERSDGIGFQLNGFGMWPGMKAKETGVPILRIGPRDDTLPDLILYEDVDPSTLYYPRIDGIDGGPNNNLATDVVNLDAIGAYNPGIRLNDGSDLGTIQRFDAYFRTEWYSSIYGAGASILHVPSRQVGAFTVRPTFGARYINTKEIFRIEGHDSGLDYEVDFADLYPNTGGGTNQNTTFLPGGADPTTIVPVTVPIRAYMDSKTQTHMAGPEFGWQYLAGGDLFQLAGETKVGIMGANQVQTLITKGIGQPFLVNDVDVPAPLLPTLNVNPNYDPFLVTRDRKTTAYVTPTFQQSLNTTTHPFAYIPILRSRKFLREANLKAGWTFLLIGQLQRPNKQIVYQSGNGAMTVDDSFIYGVPPGDPSLIPEVKKDRSVYFINYFNLGLEWNY